MTIPQRHILLGITGSVAAVKGPEIAVTLVKELNAEVKILLTRGGENFWGTKAKGYNPLCWEELEKNIQEKKIQVYGPDEEWEHWQKLGDPVLHIELRDWAHVAVVAPLSAHMLAKLAHGLCDDTLSCVLRAWDFGHSTRPAKPVVLAPAMNTAMWEHPLTHQQLNILKGFGASGVLRVVTPVVKELACGETGQGALANVSDIVQEVNTCCLSSK